MAVQVLGRRPHRPADVSARGVLDRAPAKISRVFIAELDQSDATQLGSYGLRMVVLAMREGSLDRLQHGLLAMALGAAVDVPDDRDLMIGLALPHVAANQLGAEPIQVFETTAARFDEGWLPELLCGFGARVDVTLAAFGWRQILTDDGLDVISS
ncbi:hypothetical protein ACQEVZ_28565 [Dactylosporangium sp. CA-152071]|uniref:hypothetical protein n=1 Tax=Dactylosporangium sp. CA-152071 TaxID=3239933 RepID=UPI003D94AEF9